MNDYEISKLKKELQRKQQLLKEQREDRQYTQKQLVQVQAERDKYHSELLMARTSIENVDEIIGKNIKEMKAKLQQENSLALNELRQIKDRLIQQKLLNQKLMEENRNKDTVISELSLRLKQVSRKYKDPSLLVNTKQISEQAMITHNQFYKLTQKYNKLSSDMENILTENKILRKLHGVPDNFGFDLEQIKIAQKQELEDYKSQCRKLQNQIQELEAERTQLRYRLRQYNTLYSNKGERYKDLTQQQFELLDAYALNLKEGKIQLPQIDKTQKQMEKQILKLRGQVQVLQNRSPMTSIMPVKGGNNGNEQKMNNQQIKRMQEQLKQVLQPFVQDIRKLSQNNLNSIIKNVQNVQNIQNNYNQIGGGVAGGSEYNGPIPLPIAHNDWSKIKEGYSYLYSSKIPVNLKDYEDEVGFNSIKAKYELAALQLQNIQSLKLLKEKQKIQTQLCKQVQDLKQKYKKCLKVQDQLFMRYFKDKQSVNDKIKKLEIEKANLKDERDRLELNLNSITDAFNAIKTKNDVERKLSQYTSRLAISQSQVLKLQRKYSVLNDQHKLLRQNYTNLQTRTLQSEYQLKQKLLKAKNNEKELTVLTNQILQDVKDSVSCDVHKTLVSRIQAMNDKSASLISKQTQLRLKIDKLQGIERQFNIKDQIIQNLREDNLDSLLELQILRNKLEAISQDYKIYIQTFKRLVSFVNDNNISLMSYFKKFDRDGGGNLNKTQFMSSLAALGFKMTNQQVDMMFSEFDLDGSGSITYKQFMRKMRRGGVFVRSKQEEAINRLFKAIKHAKLTIRKAFQIIDMDGSNAISKSQMESALRKIGIETNSQTIEYLFNICDKDGDGTITCNQLERLYHEMISESAILQKQVYSQQLDWKLNFILKIQQCSLKYHNSLMETFKSLDSDGNGSININQMIQFLKKAGLDIQRKYLIELFDFMDRKKDGNIQFSEFLKYLQEAKQEQKRIQRIKYIKKRTEQLRKENQIHSNYPNQKSKIGQQASMKIRMMALETKQNSLLKKNQKFIKDLATRQQQILELRKNLEEEQKSKSKVQDQYYKEKQLAIVLQERSKNSLTQLQANRIKTELNQLKIKNLEDQTNLALYKGLYEGLTDKNKGQQLRVGKIQAQRNKYYDLVKDYQGVTDLNAEVGKLAIQIEYSKRNQEVVNKKYDQIIDDIRKISAQNIKLEDISLQKQKQIINAHVFFQQKSNNLQRQIDSLNMKIIPTVTISKLEDHMIKLRQISNSKSSLEQENKLLRQKNFNLQLRNDYVQNQKVHLQELQRKLRRQYTDESSVTIIDLTKKLSDYKMSELKFKRQGNLLKEKEEYYMRVNNAHTDNIKDLEEQLGSWQIKYNQRQQFWRKRIADQISLMEDLQKQATKSKQQQMQAANFFKQKNIQTTKIAQKYGQLSGQRQQNISQFIRQGNDSMAENDEYTQKLLQRINGLQQQLLEKQKQMHHFKATLKDIIPEANIHKLTDFGSQMNVSTNSFVLQTDLTTSQLKNNARRFLNNQKQTQNFYKEENNRITLAAQQSIQTLQRIIDDKNEQIKRKQKIISDLKKEMIRTNAQNCEEIQNLNQQIRDLRMRKQAQGLNQIMTRSTNKNFYPPSSKAQSKVQDLMKLIDSKDEQIRNLQNKYDKLYIAKNNTQNQKTGTSKIQKKLQDVLQERQFQKKKFGQNQQKLQQKIKNLQKLSKDKDIKLGRLQKALQQIKNEVVNEKKVLNELQVEQNLQEFVKGMTKGTNSNDSKMEVMLQQAIQKIHVLTKQNKDLQGQIDRCKEDANKKFNQTLSKKMKP